MRVPRGVDKSEQLRFAIQRIKKCAMVGVESVGVGRGSSICVIAPLWPSVVGHPEISAAAVACSEPTMEFIDIFCQQCVLPSKGAITYINCGLCRDLEKTDNSAVIRADWVSIGLGSFSVAGGHTQSWIEQAVRVDMGGDGVPPGVVCFAHMDGDEPIGFVVIHLEGGRCSSVKFIGFTTTTAYREASLHLRVSLTRLFGAWGWARWPVEWICMLPCGPDGIDQGMRPWMIAWLTYHTMTQQDDDSITGFSIDACREIVANQLAGAYNRWLFHWSGGGISSNTPELLQIATRRRQLENAPDNAYGGVGPDQYARLITELKYPIIDFRYHCSFVATVCAAQTHTMAFLEHTGHLGYEWMADFTEGATATYGSAAYVHQWVYCVRHRPAAGNDEHVYDEMIGRISRGTTHRSNEGGVYMATLHVFAEICDRKSASDMPATPDQWASAMTVDLPGARKWPWVHVKWAPPEAMHTFVSIVVKPRKRGGGFRSEVRDIVGALATFINTPHASNHPVGVILTPDELVTLGIHVGEVCQSDEHAASFVKFGRVGTSEVDSGHRLVMALEAIDTSTAMDMLATMTPCTYVMKDSTHRFEDVGGNMHLAIEISVETDSCTWCVAVYDDRDGRTRHAKCDSHVAAFSTAINTIAEMETLPHTFLMRALNTVPLAHARKRAYDTLLATTTRPLTTRFPNAWMADAIAGAKLSKTRHVKKLYDHVVGVGAWAAFTQNPVSNQFIGPHMVIRNAEINAVGTVVPHCYLGAQFNDANGSQGAVKVDNKGGEPYTVVWDCAKRDVRINTSAAAIIHDTVRVFADDIECTTADCFTGNCTDIRAMEKAGIVKMTNGTASISTDHYMIRQCGILRIQIDGQHDGLYISLKLAVLQ